jgi:hypothetical protein
MQFFRSPQTPARFAGAFVALVLAAPLAFAQTSQQPAAAPQPAKSQPAQSAAPADSPPTVPGGKILFSRDANSSPAQSPDPSPPAAPDESQKQAAVPQQDSLGVTDAERSALTFTAYDLDVHLTPASAGISVRALIGVRNDGTVPLKRLILQITSSLHWDAFSSRLTSSAAGTVPLPFATHRVETDADHTGAMEEAVIPLPQPLAPGASLSVTALYSGAIPPSAERLERIGAPNDQALSADWDAIAAPNSDGLTGGTALRGFGNVLWYPVSAPPVFLGDGAKLFQAVGATKLRESAATVRLRLAVEYVGDPPDAAFFCGHREQLAAISDDPNMPAAVSPGIATASFDPRPLGFRTPNLFITGGAATDTGTTADPDMIAAVTSRYDALPDYAAAASKVAPLLTDWFGAQPLVPLTILDHPGQPFEDDALLVRPIRAVDPTTLTASLIHSLTHAWIHSNHAWIDEGLAQFASLLWTERAAGSPAALSELEDGARTLALAEPEVPASEAGSASNSAPKSSSSSSSSSNESVVNDPDSHSSSDDPGATSATVSVEGASLAAATGEVFYRTKAAAVWWMLRGIVGDDALKQALQAYRLDAKLDRDPEGLERTVEKVSHKDLRWFFNDWVYRDRGLPDLNIVSVTPSQIDSRGGQPTGWLVAVVVHNDGYAAAEVPVTVRSHAGSETQRLRIPGRSTASTRIVFADTPEQVEVNDGSVPETETSVHTRQLVVPGH